ncbi:hypothetical protein [Candidatus Leptofilum sp.]|uniref:hypothetical protein n=1 Tax=Candidatus Leptofilum sp. TaxID=3241576 RepID=UPI003B59050C
MPTELATPVVFILANPDLVEKAIEKELLIPYQYGFDSNDIGGWYPREPGDFFP